jgi:protein-S-isoprenylcysteine O-methyltransferase Ste14
MDRVILFIALSIPVIYFSRRSLFDIKSHGFPRFFAWECILMLLLANWQFWFADPLSITQIISWLLLLISLYMLIAGAFRLLKSGKPSGEREDDILYNFEKTTDLVTTGIYKYIRHPLYSSLFFLAWGIYFKHPTALMTLPSVLASVLLYMTCLRDEKECIAYFGDRYREYMKVSKRFIPFII